MNKEREAFERLPLAELAIKSKYVYYSEKTNSYCPNEDFCPSDAPEAMNFAWEAWQVAKAQAVPEVLKKFCNEHKDPAWRGRLTEYDKGYSDCCIAVLEMIEAAQEPAND